MNPHPNATLAAIAGAVAVMIQALLKRWWDVDLSPAIVAAITTVIISGALMVGRDGLAGLWDVLVHGASTKPPSKPTA